MRQIVGKALTLAGITLLCACSSRAERPGPDKKIAAACADNAIHINRKLEVSDLYVDRPYLRILLNPYGETYGLSDLVKFLFATKLDSIETTNRDADGNLLVSPSLVGSTDSYIRLSIKPLGHAACRAYDYPLRYPSLAMPWLRRLGLKEDSCVGIETSATITSKTGIHVGEELIGTRYNGSSWQKRLHVELRDATGTAPEVAASMIDLYAGGGGGKAGFHHYFVCDTRDSQVKAFRNAFSSRGNAAIVPPTPVEVPPYELAASYRQADDRWLGALQWIAMPGKVWSSNVINQEGTVWMEPKVTAHSQGYAFNSLSEGKLYSSPVLVPRGVPSVTGLARTANGYAVITSDMQRSGDPRYIVEFSARARILSIHELSNAQYGELTGKKH